LQERKELKRLSLVAMGNSNGVVFNNNRGEITYANEGFALMTGYAIEEVLGNTPVSLCVGPNTDPVQVEEIIGHFKRNENYTMEIVLHRKDGTWFWARSKGQAVLDEKGELIEYFTIVEDISEERKRIEEIKVLSTIAEKSRLAIIVTDADRNISWVNESFTKITGFIREECIGNNPRVLLSGPMTDNRNLDELKAKIENLEEFDTEVINYKKNGQPYFARLQGQALTDSQGNIAGYFAMHEDITQEKESIKRNKEADERLRKALDKIGDNVWEHDYRTEVTSFSKKFNPLLGIEICNEADNARIWWDSIYNNDRLVLKQIDNKLRLGEIESHSTEYRVVHADGSRKWVLDRGVVIEKDDTGLPLKIIGTHTDITKIKQLEVELSQRVKQFEGLSENIPGVIFEFEVFEDGKEKMRYVSPSMERVFGITAEAFYDFNRFIHPDDLDRITTKVKNTSRTLEPYSDESRLVKNGNEIVWRSVSASFSYMTEYGSKVFTGFMTNINEQKVSEKVIERKEEKYRSIIANMNLGLLEVDTNEIINYANQSFCDMSGYELDELIGRTASSLFLKGESLELMEQKNEARKKGVSDAYELAIVDKNNKLKWWLVSGAPRYDDNGELAGTVGIHLDITEQKAIEVELIAAREQAEQSVQAKENFLANMSHEIRTPMNAIIGMSNQLDKTMLDSKQQFFLDTIHSAADSLLVIINDILDLSKIEAGKLDIESIGFEPRHIVSKVMQTMNHKAEEKGLLFSNAYIDPALSSVLIGDPYRFTQVIVNLLSNAIKFTESGSVDLSIKVINTSRRQQNFEVIVTDTGIGMDEAFLGNLFSKFTQESQSTTREYGGTGLGMNICKQLIELMGGSINVESKKGKGTRMTILLDLPIGSISDLPVKEVLPDNISILKDKVILVTDDNEMNRLIASTLLHQYGAEVKEATNGKEALEMVEKDNIDLVLMDIQMPVMNGLEATQLIRKVLGRAIPVIAITANALKGESERCIAAGMNDYISKPFSEEIFVKTIAKWLGKEIRLISGITKLGSDAALFDLSRLQEISRGNKDFVKKMVGLFLQQVPSSIQEIREMAQSGDFEKMRSIAHRIKPSIDNLRILSVIPHIRVIESWDPSKGTLNELNDLIAKIDGVIASVVVELNKELK